MIADCPSFIPPSPSSDTSFLSSPDSLNSPMSAISHTGGAYTRHKDFYLDDGNVVFILENTYFKVHRFFFQRDSSFFRRIFDRDPSGVYAVSEFADITSLDFERFLGVLYPKDFSKHTATTVDEWSSILDISAQWAFESIQSLAIEQLTFLASPVDKIVMGRKHKVDKWLPDAYRDVCERERTLTLEEGLRLGMPEVIKISHARQAIRKDARLVALHRIDLVIEETFGLGVVPDPSAAMALETPEPSKRALEREEASLRVVESLRSISPPFSDKLGDPPSDWKIPVPATPKSPTFLPVPATPSPTFLPVPATPSPTFLPVPATPSPTFLPALRLNDDEMNYRYVTKAPTIDIDRHETSPPPERPPVKNNKGKKKGRKVVLESVDTSEMY